MNPLKISTRGCKRSHEEEEEEEEEEVTSPSPKKMNMQHKEHEAPPLDEHMALEITNSNSLNEEDDNEDEAQQDFKEWSDTWKPTLLVKLLGVKIGIKYIAPKIVNLWSKKAEVEVFEMKEDIFAVTFSRVEDYGRALLDGPWIVMDHYLMVQAWTKTCPPCQFDKVGVWIRIPNLPVKLYNQSFLWLVGSFLGKMLKFDHTASIDSSGKFARICVEIDLRKKLVLSFKCLGQDFKIEYEYLHLVCFICGKYGHKMDTCSESLVQATAGEC